jgi:hypothetical protein
MNSLSRPSDFMLRIDDSSSLSDRKCWFIRQIRYQWFFFWGDKWLIKIDPPFLLEDEETKFFHKYFPLLNHFSKIEFVLLGVTNTSIPLRSLERITVYCPIVEITEETLYIQESNLITLFRGYIYPSNAQAPW